MGIEACPFESWQGRLVLGSPAKMQVCSLYCGSPPQLRPHGLSVFEGGQTSPQPFGVSQCAVEDGLAELSLAELLIERNDDPSRIEAGDHAPRRW